MSKLTVIEKAARKLALREIAQMGGEVRAYRDLRITVAVIPSIGNIDRARFVRVAVAQCSGSDEFKRKRGELIAGERLLNDQAFSMPVDGRELFEIAYAVAEFLGE